MNKILLIIKREYWVNVNKKSFILLTIFAPFLFVLFGFIIAWIGSANATVKHLAVIDNSHWFENKFKNTSHLKFSYFTATDEVRLLDSITKSKSYDGLLTIAPAQDNLFTGATKSIKFYLTDELDKLNKETLTKQLNTILSDTRLSRLGMNKNHISIFKEPVGFELIPIGKKDKNIINSDIKFILGSVLSYIVFMFIMMYGVRIMRSILEEKTSRIVEILVASVKPTQLMLGKIIGNGLVAVTQFFIWIIIFLLVSTLFGSETKLLQTLSMPAIKSVITQLFNLNYPFIIFNFLIYFVLGYLLYAHIFSALGSIVDNETDTQQFTFIVILPLVIGIYGSISSLISNPDGTILKALSIFPLTSPVAMVIRSPYEISWIEWFLSIFILLFTIYFILQLAGKIYRIGILSYGNKLNLKLLWKWLKI